MKTLAIAIFLCGALAVGGAQTADNHEHMKDCPMMKMKAGDHNHAGHGSGDFDAMNQRGDEGMGFSQAKTTHHFLIAADGGSINVNANSADDSEGIAAIRQHFKHIAQAFAAGDFAIPMFVHDQTPPGVETMQKLRGAIQYRYQQTAAGARIVISSSRADAVAAIHDFLDFQIREHRTGDPLSTTSQ